MAHFAQLDESDYVVNVIVVNNEELLNELGIEEEALGVNFCVTLFSGRWIQTSYNANIRGRFAGIGMKYDPDKDEFVDPE